MKFKHLIAPVYWEILPSVILQMEVNESKATCDSCVMAKGPTPKAQRYENHLKCCTYYPFVPNFAVGAILSNKAGVYSHAQGVLKELISKRQYSLPMGLVAPVKYQLDFKARTAREFGRVEEWLCPYFHKEKNQCSMWAYRGAVCTSFYCKSSYGRSGKKYWGEVCDFLTYLEMALMEEALIRLDFSPRQISEGLGYLNRSEGNFEEKKSFKMPEAPAKKLWRDYYSDQEGFFIKCYEIVAAFDKKDYEEIMGEQGLQVQGELLKAYGKIKECR